MLSEDQARGSVVSQAVAQGGRGIDLRAGDDVAAYTFGLFGA